MQNYKLLNTINSPEDLKKIPLRNLPLLAEEIRSFLIEVVSKTGGHLAPSLGVVELTIALHYVLNSPLDKIVWDVGHQTYAHKVLTGRREQMFSLRQYGGISGFPSSRESEHDPFIVGHASTAISQALGLAVARDLEGGGEKIVAVVGDGSLTGGLAYEALNNVGHLKKELLIVLNDNEMSIAKNVGAMSKYLNKIITNPLYNRIRSEVEKSLQNFPRIRRLARYAVESFKHILVPGLIFEELGVRYFGPINGHEIIRLVNTLKNILKIKQPCLLHVLTKKGKGYKFAEQFPEKFHGVSSFEIRTGEKLSGLANGPQEEKEGPTYTEAFSQALLKLAEEDKKVVAITAAMPEGTGLIEFQKRFPERFFDVGIAESHAVTFAGALAHGGFKPVCAIYSTFLQRAYDQLIHDVALQKANVTLCLDRAGIVGADGATHNGLFDFSYLGSIPEAVICSPKDEKEMLQMLRLGINYPGLFALRYPRAKIPQPTTYELDNFGIGKGELLREGGDLAILSLGNMVFTALEVAEKLNQEGLKASVGNLRFLKPLDETLLLELTKHVKYVVTIEEHMLSGGLGTKILEFLEKNGLAEIRVKRFALPEEFIEQGRREFLLDKYGLSSEKISQSILKESNKAAT